MAIEKTTESDDLTRVITTLEGLHARMDSLEVGGGSKNPLKSDKRRKDDDDDDDDDDKKNDEFPPKKEEEEKDDDEGEQEEEKKAPPPVADKKKDARKDQASAPPAAAKTPPPPPPAKKDDDEEKEEEKKDDDDDDDDDKRRDAAIADAAARNQKLERQLERQNAEIARLTALMKPRSDDEHAAFADAQARADNVFAGFGKHAPRPLEGESLLSYRKRLATHLKPYSTVWKSVKFSQLPEEAFGIAETQVYADAALAAASPSDLGEGELREVAKTDPRTGLKTIMFYGKESFVKSMGRPARRVASFRTQFPH